MFLKLTPDCNCPSGKIVSTLYGVMIDQTLFSHAHSHDEAEVYGSPFSVINILINGRVFGIWSGTSKLSENHMILRLTTGRHSLYYNNGEKNMEFMGMYSRAIWWKIELVEGIC